MRKIELIEKRTEIIKTAETEDSVKSQDDPMWGRPSLHVQPERSTAIREQTQQEQIPFTTLKPTCENLPPAAKDRRGSSVNSVHGYLAKLTWKRSSSSLFKTFKVACWSEESKNVVLYDKLLLEHFDGSETIVDELGVINSILYEGCGLEIAKYLHICSNKHKTFPTAADIHLEPHGGVLYNHIPKDFDQKLIVTKLNFFIRSNNPQQTWWWGDMWKIFADVCECLPSAARMQHEYKISLHGFGKPIQNLHRLFFVPSQVRTLELADVSFEPDEKFETRSSKWAAKNQANITRITPGHETIESMMELMELLSIKLKIKNIEMDLRNCQLPQKKQICETLTRLGIENIKIILHEL